jgi:hypothetical protein
MLPPRKKKRKNKNPRRKRRRKRKSLRSPIRKTRRMLRNPKRMRRIIRNQQRRKRRRKKNKKSRWTRLPSRLTLPLLPMLLRILSHRPQFSTTKFSNSKIKERSHKELSLSKLTQWAP